MTMSHREVRLRFPGPDRDLAGTLALPVGEGRFPAAVLVSGSGPLDRDGNASKLAIDSTRQLAVALADAGIASLRFDKRGVGESRLVRNGTTEGKDDWKRAGLFDNADDVAAAFAALTARTEVDPERVFLIGHSEGAVLVAIVAARLLAAAGPSPAGAVLLAGAAKRGDAVLRWQATALAPTLPVPVRGLLRLLRTDLARQVSRNHDKLRRTTADVARLGGVRLNAKWFREYLDYDPRTDLGRLDLPVLAITGSKDLQVDPADLEAIAASVPGSVQTWLAPDVTHLLRVQPGAPSLKAYKQEVRRPVDPELIERLTGWIRAQLEQAVGHGQRTGGNGPTSAGAPSTVIAVDPAPDVEAGPGSGG